MLDKIKSLISKQLALDPDEVKEDSRIIEDLDADSLDVVELMMAIEEEFDIEVPDEVAENLVTPGKIVEYLKDQDIE
mgnify:CR=1 FL=1